MLYAAGLIQNDLAHLPEDARKRPERPLPSGRVRPRSAWIALVILVMAAMWVAGQVGYTATSHLAFALVVLITLYNYITCRIRVLGPVNMGLCRAASLLLGASAAVGWRGLTGPVPFASMTIGLYVFAVTVIAMRETQTTAVGVKRWLPSVALMVGYPFVIYALTESHRLAGEGFWAGWGLDAGLAGPVIMTYVFIMWSWVSTICDGHQLKGECAASRIGQTVGMLVRSLLLIQATLAAAAGWEGAAAAGDEGIIFAGCLFAAWPVSGLLARRFASS